MGTLTEQMLAEVPGNPLEGLRQADRLWQSYRENTLAVSPVIHSSAEPLATVDWDVVICGGTLGILLGAALAQRGWRVALIERGILRGRDQEWNISRRELSVFTHLHLLTETELAGAIATTYNPARISFHKGTELWVRDVLNIGVDPVYLLDRLKEKFLQAGGKLFEQTRFESARIHPNGVSVTAGEGFTTRLLIDAMGHFSPIARHARQGQTPDAACLVVGTCAEGFPANETGDLFVSVTPMQRQCQYFWEAFPARDGRTTYLFTYLDLQGDRPTLSDLFEDYLTLLPDYQQVNLADLTIKRALFGFFPCYRQSPLRSPWNRVLHVGDSSGNQSPLSFGGFGAMIRHLERLTYGIHSALDADLLRKSDLAALQPYQPNLSVTWLFQQSMSAKAGQSLPPDQINQLLSAVFQEMQQLGEPVLKPFLQDVVQFAGLFQTLARTTVFHPRLVLSIVPQVGIPALLEWLIHYTNLGLYSALYPLGNGFRSFFPKLPPATRYGLERWLDAVQYGSGQDYKS